MANVLPKERLQSVWGEFRDRLVLVGALAFLGLALLAGLALLPAYAALQIEQNLLEQRSASGPASADPNPQSRNERNDISRSQSLLIRVAPYVSATSSPSELIGIALEPRPKGVFVNHIGFTSGRGGTIVIDGVAPGREEINQYREGLSKNPRFTGVSVPVGALIGAEGGKFTITLSGAF